MSRMKFVGKPESLPRTTIKALWNDNRPFRLIKSDTFADGHKSTVWTRDSWLKYAAHETLICDGWQMNPNH